MRNKEIRVVAAVIERDGKYLITQRRSGAMLPLLWEFPGGRVEEAETDEQALRREVLERVGAHVTVGPAISTSVHQYDGYSVSLTIYQAQLRSKELRPLHVNDVRWIRSDEFDQYEFPPADQETMAKLLGLR